MKSTNPLRSDRLICRRCSPQNVGFWMDELLLVRKSHKHKWHIIQTHLGYLTRCGRLWETKQEVV